MTVLESMYTYPVRCTYPDCDSGRLDSAIELDEHITEEHLAEAVWTFARDNAREVEPPHAMDCICADCSGAELTADND
jgi:hypothetical protein